jgi:hypothetical protein
MNNKSRQPAQKGIWIWKDPEIFLCYNTSLEQPNKDSINFFPFEHPYSPGYLGSVGFLDIEEFPNLMTRAGMKKGFLQNHFYPLGGFPETNRPLLVGKGLAKKIELSVAKDLARQYQLGTLIAIGATSESHLEYCQRIGIIPFNPMTLEEYIQILNKPHR